MVKTIKSNASGMTDPFEHVFSTDHAIHIAEQQYLQGDAEAVFAKTVLYMIESDCDSHFTAASAQYVLEQEDITGLVWQKGIIRFVKAQNVQAHACRLYIEKQDDGANNDPDLDDIIGFVPLDFTGADAYRIGNGATYTLYRLEYGRTSNLWIPYEDEDGTYEFHCIWEDLNAAGKAGGVDQIKINVWMEVCA